MADCPVCKNENVQLWSVAKDYEYFTSNKEYKYFHCNSCFTIFINPIPIDELKIIYPPNYYSFVNQKKNFVVAIKEWLDKLYFKKILKSIPGDQLKILDVGGGTGWLADLIKKIDKRVVTTQIVDIDANAKNIAEEKGHKYFNGVLEEFETEEKFDLVLMLNLIEHVSDPLNVLKKTSTLLGKNGIILIKTPNTTCWDAKIFRKTYWGGLHCPRHWIIFSEKSFRLLLKNTNLQIKNLKYTQGAPFWAFSIIAYLHRKRLVNISADKPLIYHFLFPVISGLFATVDFVRSWFTKTAQMFIVLKKNTEV